MLVAVTVDNDVEDIWALLVTVVSDDASTVVVAVAVVDAMTVSVLDPFVDTRDDDEERLLLVGVVVLRCELVLTVVVTCDG